jgi:hypothetical protein
MDRQLLEDVLGRVEQAAEGAVRSAAELGRIFKQAKAAASKGKLSDLDRAIDQASQQLAAAAERLRILDESWVFDAASYFDSGAYGEELLAALEKEDLRPVERDGRILSFPSIVRILPSEQAIEIDRKKERSVRPSVVAAGLKKGRLKKAGLRPEQLIEVLYSAYRPLVAQHKRVGNVKLLDIHALLTQLPHAKEYSRPEFARDLLQLDMSGVRKTKGGQRLELRADTSARGGATLSAVTPEGEVRIYSSIEFKS